MDMTLVPKKFAGTWAPATGKSRAREVAAGDFYYLGLILSDYFGGTRFFPSGTKDSQKKAAARIFYLCRKSTGYQARE
jgi:hypothetical protein